MRSKSSTLSKPDSRASREALVRPRAEWVRRLRRPLAAIPRDLAWLAGALVSRPDGELFEVPFAPGGSDPRGAARRVLAGTAGSLAPNTVIVEVDEERGVLLAHRLVARGDARREADPLELG